MEILVSAIIGVTINGVFFLVGYLLGRRDGAPGIEIEVSINAREEDNNNE